MTKRHDASRTRQVAYGRRAVAELLDSGLDITELFIIPRGRGGTIDKIRTEAERKGIRVIKSSRREIERITRGENHQGVAAYYKPPHILEIEELIAVQDRDLPRPIVVLDGVEDPRNLGAVIRSAEVLGAGGVAFRRHRSAGITPLAGRLRR